MKLKGIIIVSVLLLVYGLGMYFLVGNSSTGSTSSNNTSNTNTKTKVNYMVIDNTSYRYYDGHFYSYSSSAIESLSTMKVFVNNKYFGDYKLKHVNGWNLINEKSEVVTFKGELLAVDKDFDVVVRSIKTREINEDDKYFILNNYGINSFKYLSRNQVVDIDLDKNGEMDKIICLSSMEPSDNLNNYYNLVVIDYNGKPITIVDERKENTASIYEIQSVININNNENDNIILYKYDGYMSDDSSYSNVIVSYKNDNYVID